MNQGLFSLAGRLALVTGSGQGIGLGWRHLTDRLVASGLLVRVTDHIMTTGLDFHVAWPKNRDLTDSARKVRDWLASQA